jgi:hypothetical protein
MPASLLRAPGFSRNELEELGSHIQDVSQPHLDVINPTALHRALGTLRLSDRIAPTILSSLDLRIQDLQGIKPTKQYSVLERKQQPPRLIDIEDHVQVYSLCWKCSEGVAI